MHTAAEVVGDDIGCQIICRITTAAVEERTSDSSLRRSQLRIQWAADPRGGVDRDVGSNASDLVCVGKEQVGL